jgi:GT2 family glycosyltransferase
VAANTAIDAGPPTCSCEVVMKGGAVQRHEVPIRFLFDQIELRNLALTYLATSKYAGNPQLESVASLQKFLGRQIVDLNVLISRAIVSRPHVERLGARDRRRKGSIVVCLYGRPEYLTLQSALFSGRPGIEDYEFVYVSNSPELAEQLLRDAHIAAAAYGIDLTLVLLAGNAGFGAANNVAAAQAESDRVLIVNPDVFPFDQDWAARHSRLVAELPREQTRIFGAPLYYDDGSLMHGGMYFDGDPVVSIEGSGFRRQTTLRVEHYGKGAPAYTEAFLRSRPVPAVTGAFISIDRAWFEELGGFSDEYVLGHYEDADLCLKSLEKGTPAWMHDVKLWHLEGKGSARRQAPHEGASIVNRWLFNRRWAGTIVPDLLGQQPRHPLLQGAAPVATPPAAVPILARAGRAAAKKLLPAAVPEARAVRRPQPGPPLAAGLREIVFGVEPEWELES